MRISVRTSTKEAVAQIFPEPEVPSHFYNLDDSLNNHFPYTMNRRHWTCLINRNLGKTHTWHNLLNRIPGAAIWSCQCYWFRVMPGLVFGLQPARKVWVGTHLWLNSGTCFLSNSCYMTHMVFFMPMSIIVGIYRMEANGPGVCGGGPSNNRFMKF